MSNPFVDRFMKILHHRVNDRLTFEIQRFDKSEVLYVRYGRFVLERVQMKYLRFISRSEDDLWRHYIIPLRRRLSTIRNPIEWRIAASTDKIPTA